MNRQHSLRHLLLVVLGGAACAPGPTAAAGEASELLRMYPAAEQEARLRQAVGHAAVFANRRNVRITPPGQWFATCMVEGAVPEGGLEGLMGQMLVDAERHVLAHGGQLSGPPVLGATSLPEGLPYAVLGEPPVAGEAPPVAIQRTYEAAGRRGAITVLALPARQRAGYWRIGVALHEP